jgi:hypothetical protein
MVPFNFNEQFLCACEELLRINVTALPIRIGVTACCEERWRQEESMPEIFWG